MLPFIPETIEQLRNRYPKCLEKIWTMDEILKGNRPGLSRDYVFDFPDGLRLLISKSTFEFPNERELREHVSASWEDNLPRTWQDATAQVENAWHQIGGKGSLQFLGMSANAIPHWIVKE